MYEVKFISGAIAGALAGGDSIGYVGDYPIFGQVASINAFALGVQLTNPRTRVYLEWSSVSSGESAVQRLTDRGIRLISAQDLTKLGGWKDSSFGLSLVGEDGQVNLAMPVWRWGVYYEELLRRIRNKSFQAEYQESPRISCRTAPRSWPPSSGTASAAGTATPSAAPCTRRAAGRSLERPTP